MKLVRRVAWGLAVSLAAACAPSESEVKRDFDEVVSRSNACAMDSDCVSVSPGCPLGCGVAVNRAQKGSVERHARELIADYERWGRGCDYECVGAGPPVCKHERCALSELTDPNAADAGSNR